MPGNVLYWILQLSGWTFFTLLLIFLFLFFSEDSNTRTIISLQVLIGFSLMTASHIERLIFKRLNILNKPSFTLIAYAVGLSIIAAFGAQVLIHIVLYALVDWEGIRPFNITESLIYWLNASFTLLLWTFLYISIKSFEHRKQKEVENWKLKAELKEAELGILKAQINPHFLFNALNNIRSLIAEDSDKARKMVNALSNLLRYAIYHNEKNMVKLEEELSVVNHYLELESIQYEDRLQYSFTVDNKAEEFEIPSMIIQMMVENAVKHGISKNKSGGKIEVVIKMDEDHLDISVLNDGKLMEKEESTEGIGVSNIKNRIGTYFGDKARFTLMEAETGKVKSSVLIPRLS